MYKSKIYLTNRCDVWPSDAVQCINGVVKVAEPLPGLVRIRHLLLGRVTLYKDNKYKKQFKLNHGI